MTVLPERAISCTFSITLYALVESRPEVGSSKNRSEGPCIISTPMETLRRSPPETPRVPSSPIYKLKIMYSTHCRSISSRTAFLLDSELLSSSVATNVHVNSDFSSNESEIYVDFNFALLSQL
ncbi:hypothetical protein Leryth_006679 [Lithospermum erythrorhizon]|nr:hypothetical protein Leryth_006679 [Lithospermum erythrorhizon]